MQTIAPQFNKNSKLKGETLMKKHFKVLTSALTVLLVATALVGCGKKTESNDTNKAASGGKTITVWSHFGEKELASVKPVAEEWAKKTGNTVKVINDKGDFQSYLQAANSAKGPDIMFGVPHDNLGTYQKANLLEPVPDGVIDKSKYSDTSINAVSINKQLYAVPLSVESLALIYNPDKVPTPPATMDDFIATAQKVGFKFEAKNLYYAYPFIAAYGGYIFKDNGGQLDASQLGLDNAGAVKGFQMLQDFVQKYHFMTPDTTSDNAKADFKAGKIGMYISGSWDLGDLEAAKANYKIATLPTIDGKVPTTFLGVQAAFVNSKSKNKTEAWDLMKYLVNNTAKGIYENENHRLPAMNGTGLEATIASSKYNMFNEQAKHAYPMPNIPEMQSVWKINDSLPLLLTGKMTADAYAKKVTADVKQAIAASK